MCLESISGSVLVFFDDNLIYNMKWEDHLQHLRVVLQILESNQLFESKSCFGCEQVDYLEHVISCNVIAIDPKRVDAIVNWPLPKNRKALRGFLGLIGYYRKFIKLYVSRAAPLHALLKKREFSWSTQVVQAFEELKH